MPRVSDAHRQARRDQIADAVVQVARRHGISEASMSQISAECGLSIGAIYANFEDKADLARYVAGKLFDWRIADLESMADGGATTTPMDVLRLLLGSMAEQNRPAPSVILQFWSKAGVDDGLRAVLNEQVGRLRAGVEQALRPWADDRSGGDGSALARQTASACMIIGQGFLANRELFGWMDAEEYLEAVAVAFGPDL
jgi:TetR/AcrR family transcriptional regulator, transcriptional repressor of aconitase